VSRFASLIIVFLTGTVWLGCSRGEKPTIQRISVEFYRPSDAFDLGYSTVELQGLLENALSSHGVRSAKEQRSSKNGWRADAMVELERDTAESGDERTAVIVALKLRREGDDTGREIVRRAEGKAKGASLDERREALRSTALSALDRAARAAQQMMVLVGKNDSELVALKDGPSSQVALQLLAERRNPAAFEPLVRRLQSDNLDDVRRAMGDLLELRDLRAVAPLIEASRAQNAVFQREVVFALGVLGGDEAEAYLRIIAEGHDLPALRASAQQALDELAQRKEGIQRTKGKP
jgi:hypothetical protein